MLSPHVLIQRKGCKAIKQLHGCLAHDSRDDLYQKKRTYIPTRLRYVNIKEPHLPKPNTPILKDTALVINHQPGAWPTSIQHGNASKSHSSSQTLKFVLPPRQHQTIQLCLLKYQTSLFLTAYIKPTQSPLALSTSVLAFTAIPQPKAPAYRGPSYHVRVLYNISPLPPIKRRTPVSSKPWKAMKK